MAGADSDLLIVSDGISRKPGGDQASKLVTEWLPLMIGEQRAALSPPDINAACVMMRGALVQLNERIRDFGAAAPGLHGLGATVVAACMFHDTAIVGHLGDSRAYLLRNGRLQLLTSDHTIAGLLLRSGEITAAEAQRHPGRAVLSRYVGMERFTYADVQAVPLHSRDRLLLCTDGLTGVISDDVICELLCEHETPAAAAHALVDGAIAAAAPDNVTVVVADWGAVRNEREDCRAR